MFKRASIFLALIIFIPFLVNAQYRRRHADVTREMVRLLREPKPQDYFFSLLPPDLSHLVCKMADLDVQRELKKAIEKENKEDAIFLASFSLSLFKNITRNWAFWKGNLFAARLFISTNPDTKEDELYTDLWRAVYDGFAPIVKLCLDVGINPNRQITWSKYSLLNSAIDRDHSVCVKMLLAAGANPNKRGGKFLNPPLVTAVKKNDIGMVKLLLWMKANPNRRAKEGHNALYFAAENNNLEMVRLLLVHGCSARYVSPWRISSPLQEAALHGNIEMVKLLLNAGASPRVETYERRSTVWETFGCYEDAWVIIESPPVFAINEIEKLLEQARAKSP